MALVNLSSLAIRTANLEEARRRLRECFALVRGLDEKHGGVLALEAAAELALEGGADERAARLFGAAKALREGIGVHLNERSLKQLATQVARLRGLLGEARFRQVWAAGRSATFEEALRLADRSPITPD